MRTIEGIAMTAPIINSAIATKPGSGRPAIGGSSNTATASSNSDHDQATMRAQLATGHVSRFQCGRSRHARSFDRRAQRADDRNQHT